MGHCSLSTHQIPPMPHESRSPSSRTRMQVVPTDITGVWLQTTSLLVGPSGILEYVWQGPASHVLHAMMGHVAKAWFPPPSQFNWTLKTAHPAHNRIQRIALLNSRPSACCLPFTDLAGPVCTPCVKVPIRGRVGRFINMPAPENASAHKQSIRIGGARGTLCL